MLFSGEAAALPAACACSGAGARHRRLMEPALGASGAQQKGVTRAVSSHGGGAGGGSGRCRAGGTG